MSGPRDTPTALAALLDALEADLLDAPAHEVTDALRETRRARDRALHEVRSLLRDIQADETETVP